MVLTFNMLLEAQNIDPASVRLLRHQPIVAGRSLVDVWRADRTSFEDYQSLQLTEQRARFAHPCWASFAGTTSGRTVFLGLYRVAGADGLAADVRSPLTDAIIAADTHDRYTTERMTDLAGYEGRLFIDWGGGSSGKRAWVQRANAQNKPITELHLTSVEEPFPGLLNFTRPLDEIGEAPAGWMEHLQSAKGVYLLTCSRDGSHYVGSATGGGGFWNRWAEYRANGHGGNVALRARDRSNYLVSILQVAGSTDTNDDILRAEQMWKAKLQTGMFGLTRN